MITRGETNGLILQYFKLFLMAKYEHHQLKHRFHCIVSKLVNVTGGLMRIQFCAILIGISKQLTSLNNCWLAWQ